MIRCTPHLSVMTIWLATLSMTHAAEDRLANLTGIDDRLVVHPRLRVGGRADSNPSGATNEDDRQTEWASITGIGCGTSFAWSEITTLHNEADFNAVFTNRDETRRHLEGGASLSADQDLGVRQSHTQVGWRRASDPDSTTGEQILSDIFTGVWSGSITGERHRLSGSANANRTVYQQTATSFSSGSRNGNAFAANLTYGLRTTGADDLTAQTGLTANRYDQPEVFQNSNGVLLRGGWAQVMTERLGWHASLGAERRWYQATDQEDAAIITGPSWDSGLSYLTGPDAHLKVTYSGGLSDSAGGQPALTSSAQVQYDRALNDAWSVYGLTGVDVTRDLQDTAAGQRDIRTTWSVGGGAQHQLRPGLSLSISLRYDYYQSRLVESFQRVGGEVGLVATF